MNFATHRLFNLLQCLHLVAKSFLWYLFHMCDNHIILLLSVVDISFVFVVDV